MRLVDVLVQIFKSEDVDLPRNHVADYLEKISPLLCTNYLEYLIQERGEVSVDFHDRLVELYAKITLEARRKKEESEFPFIQNVVCSRSFSLDLRQQTYDKLMTFISTTTHYRVDRLYGLLSSEGIHSSLP